MSNNDRLSAILVACDEFESGQRTLSSLQATIEANGEALEAVPRSVFSTLHDFCNALEKIEFACLAERQLGEGKKVTSSLRTFIASLES